MTERIAQLVGGPCDGWKVRADLLDREGIGSMTLVVETGPPSRAWLVEQPRPRREAATYWRAETDFSDELERWDFKPMRAAIVMGRWDPRPVVRDER